MNFRDVSNPTDALVYLTDCTLATVCDLASKKSKSKHEYHRQISMAQKAIGWMREFGVDFSSTRAKEVVDHHKGSVADWAAQWEIK